MNYSYRDQLSFNWSAWCTKTPITYLNEDIYKRDVENETSKYFFLPWPKHNNPNVVEQLQARLNKNPVNNLVVQQIKVQKTSNNQMNEFVSEYQKFIEDLKKKKEEKRLAEEAANKETMIEPSAEQPVKKKRGRKKKEK